MQLPSIIVAATLLLLVGMGCATGGQTNCPEGMDGFIELNVYFGQEKGDGTTVSDEEWQAFLADTVTLRFPDGLTVLDARGQWLDTSEGRLYRESTRLLNVLVPADSAPSSAGAVREIADIYKERFDQQVVFHTALPVCAELY